MGVFDPDRHDNILGITDLNELNAQEALGIIRAEEFILDLPLDFVFDVKLVLDIHTTAFGHLTDMIAKILACLQPRFCNGPSTCEN